MQKKYFKPILITVAAVLAAAAVIGIALSVYSNVARRYDKNDIVAYVDCGDLLGAETDSEIRTTGMPVYAGELEDEMQRRKADVISQYREKDPSLTVDNAFWDTEIDGTTPLKTLRQTALQNVKTYKIQQCLGLQYGLVTDPSYAAFLKDMEAENASRSAAVAAGQVIYGAESFTKDTYYQQMLSYLQNDLKEAMSKTGEPLYADEKDYRAYYEEIKDTSYKKEDERELIALSISFAGNGSNADIDLLDAASAKARIDAAHDFVSDMESWDETAFTAAFPEMTVRTLSLNADTTSQAQKSAPEMYEQAVQLDAGEISPVFEDMSQTDGGAQNSYRFLVCRSFADGGYFPYDEIASALAMQYADDAYDAYIQKLDAAYTATPCGKYDKVDIR